MFKAPQQSCCSGNIDFAAAAPQHPDRGVVHVAEEQRHDAAIEHGDAGTARADGRQHVRGRLKEFCRDRRQHGIHGAQPLGHKQARELLQTGTLVQAQERED